MAQYDEEFDPEIYKALNISPSKDTRPTVKFKDIDWKKTTKSAEEMIRNHNNLLSALARWN